MRYENFCTPVCKHTFLLLNIQKVRHYVFIYIYMCVCVCVYYSKPACVEKCMPAANVILLLMFYSFATRHSYEKGIQELSSV